MKDTDVLVHYLSSLSSAQLTVLFEGANEMQQEEIKLILNGIKPMIEKMYRRPEFREHKNMMSTEIDWESNYIYFCKYQGGSPDGRTEDWYTEMEKELLEEIQKKFGEKMKSLHLRTETDDDLGISIVPDRSFKSLFYKKD